MPKIAGEGGSEPVLHVSRIRKGSSESMVLMKAASGEGELAGASLMLIHPRWTRSVADEISGRIQASKATDTAVRRTLKMNILNDVEILCVDLG